MENYERRCKGGAWRRRKVIEPEINSEMQKDRERERNLKVSWGACAENAHYNCERNARSDMHRGRKSSETGQEQAQRLK